jgi:hypothetical protein
MLLRCLTNTSNSYACGKLGHISRDCTAASGGPNGLDTAGKTCYRCSETGQSIGFNLISRLIQVGHISRNCPQAEVNGEAAAVPAATPVPTAAPTTAVA